jgi:cell division protein FtsL
MAVNIRQLFPLQQAKARRSQLPRYLRLDGGRYLIAAALILSLLSLISLGQTGRLATQGYEIAQLQKDQVNLLRQRSALQLELSEAQSLAKIEQRARDLHMRPMTPDQARYITIGAPPEKPEQKAESQKP